MGGSGAVEFGLKITGKRLLCLVIRVRKAHRRHLVGADLAENFFPRVGVTGNFRKIEAFERKAGRFQLIVVASDAILLDQRSLRSGGLRRGGSLGLANCEWRDGCCGRQDEPKCSDQ